jgi:hypothetical protein
MIPGETCGVPRQVGDLPFADNYITVGSANHYSYSTGVCPGEEGSGGGASGDIVYEFTPDITGTYQVDLYGFDSAIYIVTNCDDIDNTCVAGAENVGSVEQEIIQTTLNAGTTYYIIIDGASNVNNLTGSYFFNVSLL